jgi:hypothetical protein
MVITGSALDFSQFRPILKCRASEGAAQSSSVALEYAWYAESRV